MDIIVNKEKIIIDGHAKDTNTCNTLTNICDVLANSDKFETIKYENGYAEFDSIEENNNKKFAPSRTKSLYIIFPDTVVEAYIIIDVTDSEPNYKCGNGIQVLHLQNETIEYQSFSKLGGTQVYTPIVDGNSYTIPVFCSDIASINRCVIFYK